MKPFRALLAGLILFVIFTIGVFPAEAAVKGSLWDPLPVPHTVIAGQPVTFQIHFKKDDQGDIPDAAYVDLMLPDKQQTQVKFPDSQRIAAVKGDALITSYIPTETGVYGYRFHVEVMGDSIRYPDAEWLSFTVRPNWFPYAVIAAGFFLSFLVISTLVYQVMHRGIGSSQHNSARVAIMIGGICWILSILYALDWLTNIIAWVGAGVVILLLLVWALIAR